MIEAIQLQGPYGIPVIYQRMPEMVGSVAMSWALFTGAADDESVGSSGLYHWFEHVPFRGTKKFPGGYEATQGWANRYNGSIGASTNLLRTTFNAHVPVKVWKKGLECITDLISQPLIREEDVNAERDVIRQEIAYSNSQLRKFISKKLGQVIYRGHPYANNVLGTELTLDSMTPSTLKKAWEYGYDHRRLAFVCVGNIPLQELESELQRIAPVLPDNNLSERRVPAHYGMPSVWRGGETTIERINFSSSLVYMIFQLNKKDLRTRYFDGNLLDDLFSAGRLASPLYRTIREKHRLAYATSCETVFLPDSSFFGICVETKNKNIDAVIQGLYEVINDPVVRSPARLQEIKEMTANCFSMFPIDPNRFSQVTLHRYQSTHALINDHDFERAIDQYDSNQVAALLDQLTPNKAHVVVFQGVD